MVTPVVIQPAEGTVKVIVVDYARFADTVAALCFGLVALAVLAWFASGGPGRLARKRRAQEEAKL